MNKPALFCFLLEASTEVHKLWPYIEWYISQFTAKLNEESQICILAYGDNPSSNTNGLACWTLVNWTTIAQFTPQWITADFRKDISLAHSPVSSSNYALPEGLCTASSMIKLVAREGDDQYLITFLGASFSTSECSLCGYLHDLEQHVSQLAREDIAMSFISVRPTPGLKKLWEHATLSNALREKQIAQLSENEFKFFYGHRLGWPIHIPPPVIQQNAPAQASRPTAGAALPPGATPKNFGDHMPGMVHGAPKGASAYGAGMPKDGNYHHAAAPTGHQLKVVAKKT